MAFEAIARVRAVAQAGTDRRGVTGWVLYDLANTIFSLNIVSLYFSLWVVDDKGGRDGDYLIANSVSMALMFLTAPLLGALSDQTPRRMPFLVFTTVVCCVFTALLGLGGLTISLIFFVIANYFYQGGLIFYDALLPSVSTEETRGRISGLGVSVGYIGSLIGIGMGLAVTSVDESAKPVVFRLTALLFLLFALPCFLWVKERPKVDAVGFGRESLRRAWKELGVNARRARRYPNLMRFLFGRIFYTDAANTMIAVIGIYGTKEIGFSDAEIQAILMVGIVGSLFGGIIWGQWVDEHSPRWALDRVLAMWVVLLLATAAIGFFELPKGLFWIIGLFAGFSLAGTWAADRPLMLRLTPPRYLGAFYGLYAMVGRFAAIIGPLLWTVIVDAFGWGRPAAIVSLAVMVLISLIIIRGVNDARTNWPLNERMATNPNV